MPATAADRRVTFTPRQNGYSDGYTPSDTVTVSVAADSTSQGHRTVTITGSSPYNPNFYSPGRVRASFFYRDDLAPVVASTTLTVLDAQAEQLTLNVASSTINESGSGNSTTVSVSRAAATTSSVSVTLVAMPGAGASSSDFTLGTTTLTIPANGTSSPTTTFAAVDNSVAAANKEVTLTATVATATSAYRDSAPVTLTIDDDETDTLELSTDATNGTLAEGGTATVTVARPSGSPTTAAVAVTLSGVAGTGATASDFSLSPASLTIATGATSATATFTATDDDTDGPETKMVTLRAATSSTGYRSADDVTLTITDNDVSALTVDEGSDGSTTTTEDLGTDTFTVRLATEPRGAPVVVAVSSDDTDECVVSVDGGANYGSGALTFVPAGGDDSAVRTSVWNTAQTVTVRGVNDALLDGDQTCTVRLNPSSPGMTGDATYDNLPDVTVDVTNTDNNVRPTLALSASSVSEGGAATVTASLAAAAAGAVTITVSAAPVNPATAGDYSLSSNTTLTIAAGATSSTGTVTISATDDNTDGPETKQVTVSAMASGGNAVDPADLTLTINDDDDAGLVLSELAQAADPRETVTESGDAEKFRVALATQPTAAVTVTVTSDDDTECRVSIGSAAPAASTALTFGAAASAGPPPVHLWSAAQEVTVTGQDDTLIDGNQDCTITVAATSADSIYGSNNPGDVPDVTFEVRNTDNDTAGLVLSKTTVGTSESGSTDSFTVKLAAQPMANVTVAVSSSDTSEATASPSQLVFGTTASPTSSPPVHLWNADPPPAVTVTGVDDSPADLDGPQMYTITLDPSSSGDSNYNGLPNVVLQGVNQDNEAPTVTLSVSPGSIAEDGGTAAVTASLDRAVGVATTVDVSAAAGTGASAGDFRLSANRRLTVAANSRTSTGEVTITAVDNNTDAPDKTVTVSGTTSGGQGAADPMDATLTITDDEAAPTVSLSVADRAIWEDGGATAVSARLSHPSSAETRVTVTTASAGITLGADNVIVIPAGRTTSPDTVAVAAVDNNQASNADLVAALAGTVQNSQGEGEVRGATLTVWDNETASVSLALEPERVAEGAAARVSAALTRPARTALTLTVSAAPGEGATEASFRLGAERTLSVAAGARASAGSVELLAVDDEVDAPDRVVLVSASVEGRARTPDPVALTIADDDETPRAMLILTPAMIDESGAENMAAVTAALERPSSEATTIMVSAAPGADEIFTQRGTTLTIAAGRTASAGSVTITAEDDSEQTPDREVRVEGRAENAHGVVQPEVAVLTIRDDDGTEAVTEVLLPEAARAMADSRATAVRRRLERAAAGEASDMPSLTAASAMGLLAEHGASLQKDDLDWKTLLPRTSFALPLSAAGGDGGSGITVWGGGDYRDLDGEARGIKWDGEVSSLHLGADRLLANGMRAGVAASWSEAKFDYKHRNQGGDWELEMTSVQPYLGWTMANGLELWASAGAGSGELDLSGRSWTETSDADMWLAAAGARGPLYMTEAGLRVSLRGEALYSSFEVDGNRGRIRGYTADASRLRLALEARRERVLESGALLSPRFELGVRHDGGDGETGAGVELGGGAEYAAGRLSVSGGARALVANSDYDEWGADFALAYAARADGRGLSFRLMPSWGSVQSGTQALWENGAPGLGGAAEETDPAARLEAELGYGLKSPWSRGTLQLTLGGEAGEDADAACRLRGAVALDATATLGLELEVRDPQTGGAERSLMVTGELRF